MLDRAVIGVGDEVPIGPEKAMGCCWRLQLSTNNLIPGGLIGKLNVINGGKIQWIISCLIFDF